MEKSKDIQTLMKTRPVYKNCTKHAKANVWTLTIKERKKFCEIICLKEGIYLYPTDTPSDESIYRKISDDRRMTLPMDVIQAYELKNFEDLYHVQAGVYFIKKTRKNPIQSKLIGLTFKDDANLPARRTFKHMQTFVLSSRMELPEKFSQDLKVTVHLGNTKFVEVQEATKADKKKYLTIERMRKLFGSCLQHYAGERLTYIQKPNSTQLFRLPLLFVRAENLGEAQAIRITEDHQGTLFISKVPDIDFVTDQEIEPTLTESKEVKVCEEIHEELPDLRELIQAITESTKTLQTLIGSLA